MVPAIRCPEPTTLTAPIEAIGISTTLLVPSWPEGGDLIGLDQPKDQILKQPGEDLPVHGGKCRTG